MSLRDYFAAQAMLLPFVSAFSAGAVAKFAYDVADAMLKAREAE